MMLTATAVVMAGAALALGPVHNTPAPKPPPAKALPVSGAGWAATPSAFRIMPLQKDDRIEVMPSAGRVAFIIRDPSGIGGATITRTGGDWPATVVVRLCLRGLESLTLTAGDITLIASVASHGDHARRVVRRNGGADHPLDNNSPYWADIRIRSDSRRIPLKDGYFELTVPAAILRNKADSLSLRWIDFYRG